MVCVYIYIQSHGGSSKSTISGKTIKSIQYLMVYIGENILIYFDGVNEVIYISNSKIY